MTINAINIIPKKTDSCPVMGDYAISKKMKVSWANKKKGDIVLFDFNHNGTSDHIGILVSVNKDGSIETIEGNTGSGNNTNGGQVQKRTRYKSQVNYFVRPKYTDEITADMVIATARAELGTKESPRNSNKVKYNRWFYGSNTSAFWCCTFVCWLFAHVIVPEEIKAITKPTGKYTGSLPLVTIKEGSKGSSVESWQKFLNWYGSFKLTVDGDYGTKTAKATKVFQKTESLKPDAVVGKNTLAKAKAYLSTTEPKETPKTEEPKGYDGTFPSIPPMTAKIAVECAYAYKTSPSTYKYKGGKPKASYKKRLNEAFPKRKTWKYAKSRAGASCDVFVGTVLRISGYKKAPHAMSKFVAWCKKNLASVSTMKNGDILTRTNHIMVCVDLKGHKRVANAHYQTLGGTYGIIEKVGSYTKIWRPKGLSYFSKGDTFTDVKKLQKFLNWYGDYGLKLDYEFGNLTEYAVKDFQKNEGLAVNGKFGEAELAKAKAIKK